MLLVNTNSLLLPSAYNLYVNSEENTGKVTSKDIDPVEAFLWLCSWSMRALIPNCVCLMLGIFIWLCSWFMRALGPNCVSLALVPASCSRSWSLHVLLFCLGLYLSLPQQDKREDVMENSNLAKGFKGTFSQKNVRVHFVGVWSVFMSIS